MCCCFKKKKGIGLYVLMGQEREEEEEEGGGKGFVEMRERIGSCERLEHFQSMLYFFI